MNIFPSINSVLVAWPYLSTGSTPWYQQGVFSSFGFLQFLFWFDESFLFASKFRNLEQTPTPFLLQVALVESLLAFSIGRISEAARGCEEMRNQDLSINRFWHPWCGTARLLQYFTRILFQPWCAAHLRLLARSTVQICSLPGGLAIALQTRDKRTMFMLISTGFYGITVYINQKCGDLLTYARFTVGLPPGPCAAR